MWVVGRFLLLSAIATTGFATTAVCRLDGSGKGLVAGELKIEGDGELTRFTGLVSGLSPGLHGFHVHANGDIGNQCKAAGGHFNPFGKNHGAPDAQERHVGDLGNILTPDVGKTRVAVADRFALLDGAHSIIGKAIVIHEGTDDLGLGGDAGSLATGNAGARAACCIITETFPLFSWKYVMSVITSWGAVVNCLINN
eukprot:TRINITY_DN28588_c0_g1_i1.p1 TRINITY_DN28588_c0_g1~~TRINITY_DN28588_c0_g1_i1.p1  ORF type:complete len:197 (+),score=25.13 TRINITY_DN28588_c0_g1_i1:81-671(+)